MELLTPFNTELEKLKLSEAISVVEHENGKCLIRNKINNKEFILGKKEADVVKYFSNDQVINEESTNDFFVNVVRYLKKKEILIDRDKTFEEMLKVFSQPFSILERSASFCELKSEDVCFIGIPYSKGNHSGGGCDKAPNAIRSWLKSRGVNHNSITNGQDITKFMRVDAPVNFDSLSEKLAMKKLVDIGDFYFYPYEDNSKIFQQLTSLSENFTDRKVSPIYFGGDHSITFPILKGLAKQGKEFYLLHIDAHTDLYQSPVDNIYDKHCVNHHGNFLTKCLNEIDQLAHVFQFGIRGINNLGTKPHSKITTFGIRDVLDLVRQGNVKEALDIPENARIYLSLDVDVLDPAIFPATNSPVAGGLQYHELLTLLSVILRGRALVGADIVEFNPSIDKQEISHQIFSEILLFIANFVGECYDSE
jgi:agmatinase